jgi:hypothetical protein
MVSATAFRPLSLVFQRGDSDCSLQYPNHRETNNNNTDEHLVASYVNFDSSALMSCQRVTGSQTAGLACEMPLSGAQVESHLKRYHTLNLSM